MNESQQGDPGGVQQDPEKNNLASKNFSSDYERDKHDISNAFINLQTLFTPDQYAYIPVRKITETSERTFSFQVKCSNDAHVLLTAGSREFEVVIGGGTNSFACIRSTKQGINIVEHSLLNGLYCSTENMKKYRIDWSNNNLLVFHYLNTSDSDSLATEILRIEEYDQYFIDVDFISQISVSTYWSSTGEWIFENSRNLNKPKVKKGGMDVGLIWDHNYFLSKKEEFEKGATVLNEVESIIISLFFLYLSLDCF